jgi:isocitrate dehydrogenase kinase/phosphatase
MPNTHFPKLLSSQIAFDIARTILDGFDKHYHLFRISSQQAKQFFEAGDWKAAQIAARERIQFYDTACGNVCACWKMTTMKTI